MNVVLYLRVSTEKQDTSIGDQRATLVKYAKERKYRVVSEYVDDGISGDNTEKRVAFQRMIADAKKGGFSTILCWDQDRFGRFDALEAGYWIKPLKDAGIVLETIAQGRIDWTDFAGRMMYAIQQEAKHTFLRDLSRNVARGMVATIEAGHWPGGPAPYGYQLRNQKLVIDRVAAKVVRSIFRDFLRGDSAHVIAGRLNREGVPTSRRGLWASTTVLLILRQEMYTGTLVWNRRSKSKYARIQDGNWRPSRPAKSNGDATGSTMRVPNHHPVIIDATTFDAVQREMPNRRKRTTPAVAKAVFALTGLIFCGKCGGPMHGRRRNRLKTPFYCCSKAIHNQTCLPHYVKQEEVLRCIAELPLAISGKPARRQQFLAGVMAALHTGEQPESRDDSKQRLDAVRIRLRRAEKRLVECDKDMLPLVQRQIREMHDDEARLLKIVSSPAPRKPADVAQEYLAKFEDLRDRFSPNADMSGLRTALGQFVSRVEVHVASMIPPNRTLRRYRFEGIVLHLSVEGFAMRLPIQRYTRQDR